jgi:hypothetical protein
MRRLALLLALLFALAPFFAAAAPKKLDSFSGKVVPLSKVLAKAKIDLDPDAAAHWLALVTADGKVYPLIKNAGSRAFFQDKSLHDRPMQLLGRVVEGSQLLQVNTINSVIEGKVHDLYYWCDICSIRRPEKNACECCGGAMELREVPMK